MAVDGRALAMRWSAQVLRSALSVRWSRNRPGLSGRPRFRANASVELAWLLRSDASEGLRNGRIWGARSVAREFVHIAFLVHVGLRGRAEGPNLFPTPIDPRSLAFTSLYMNSRIGGAGFRLSLQRLPPGAGDSSCSRLFMTVSRVLGFFWAPLCRWRSLCLVDSILSPPRCASSDLQRLTHEVHMIDT